MNIFVYQLLSTIFFLTLPPLHEHFTCNRLPFTAHCMALVALVCLLYKVSAYIFMQPIIQRGLSLGIRNSICRWKDGSAYSVQFIVFVQCIEYSVLQCIVYSEQCIVYSVYCWVESVQCTLYTVYCILYTVCHIPVRINQ